MVPSLTSWPLRNCLNPLWSSVQAEAWSPEAPITARKLLSPPAGRKTPPKNNPPGLLARTLSTALTALITLLPQMGPWLISDRGRNQMAAVCEFSRVFVKYAPPPATSSAFVCVRWCVWRPCVCVCLLFVQSVSAEGRFGAWLISKECATDEGHWRHREQLAPALVNRSMPHMTWPGPRVSSLGEKVHATASAWRWCTPD